MGPKGKEIAQGTGMTAAVLALGTVMQLLYFKMSGGDSITDEQGDALAVIMYPFVAWLWGLFGYRLQADPGVDPKNGQQAQPQPQAQQ